MEYIEKIKKMLCKELDEYAMKNKLAATDLDMIWKLTDTVKNLGKIEMLEEESGGYSERRGGDRGGSSYGDDEMMYSERRGRGRRARRDSMGRYANRGGSSYDEYSEEGGSSYREGRGGRSSYGGGSYGYSEAESKEMSKRKHILPVFFFKFQESPKEVSLIRRTELHVHTWQRRSQIL